MSRKILIYAKQLYGKVTECYDESMKITFEDRTYEVSDIYMHYLPIYGGIVSCGLFGISDDFAEDHLSLDKKFIQNKATSFFVKAEGQSMRPSIIPGDILIIDRSIEIFHGAVATFFYNGKPICKQYIKENGKVILRSFNKEHKDIHITDTDQLDLFGVVTGLARNLY